MMCELLYDYWDRSTMPPMGLLLHAVSVTTIIWFKAGRWCLTSPYNSEAYI